METEFYRSSKTFVAECTYGDVLCYENGDPNGDVVVFIHGWNSNAGSSLESLKGSLIADTT